MWLSLEQASSWVAESGQDITRVISYVSLRGHVQGVLVLDLKSAHEHGTLMSLEIMEWLVGNYAKVSDFADGYWHIPITMI